MHVSLRTADIHESGEAHLPDRPRTMKMVKSPIDTWLENTRGGEAGGLQQWKPEIDVDAMGPTVCSIAAMAAELHAN